jgi:hypothetical protein
MFYPKGFPYISIVKVQAPFPPLPATPRQYIDILAALFCPATSASIDSLIRSYCTSSANDCCDDA